MYVQLCMHQSTRTASAKMGRALSFNPGLSPSKAWASDAIRGGEPVRTHIEKEQRDVAPSKSRIRVLINGKGTRIPPRTRPAGLQTSGHDHSRARPSAWRGAQPHSYSSASLRLLISAFPAIGGHLLMMGTDSDAASRTWSPLARYRRLQPVLLRQTTPSSLTREETQSDETKHKTWKMPSC